MSNPRVAERLAGSVQFANWAQRAARITGCLALLWCAAPSAPAAIFTGTVFEDADYGGGAGRSRTTAAGTVLSGVTVELYRVSNNAFVATTTTDGAGFYSLSSGNTNNFQVRVRVVNGTVRSARTGGSGCATCVPVQTYRTDASSGAAVPVTDHVGGENPALSDAIINTTSAAYNTLTVAGSRVPQSISTATPSSATATVSGIDFGFNFDTVVNTRDGSASS